MRTWVQDTRNYDVGITGQREDTRLWVQGAMDPSESERPKIILEEHQDNKGLSLSDERSRNQAIDSLSKSMEVNPNEVDWYVRTNDGEGGEGKLEAVEVFQNTVTKVNPQFTHWDNSGEFNINNREEAKKFFPDITVEELSSRVKEPTTDQTNQVSEAFNGQHRESLNTQVQEQASSQQQSENIDLSQEYFNSH
jgi:hypothetical protein